jgi:hypothetical protein
MKYKRQESLPYPQPWEFILNKISGRKERGFFVDVGANDGLITEIIKVPSKTLNSILHENNVKNVDYLSIDTEGHEFIVIQSLDLEKYKVKIISVENSDGNKNVLNYLKQYNYNFIQNVCGDDIFIKNI